MDPFPHSGGRLGPAPNLIWRWFLDPGSAIPSLTAPALVFLPTNRFIYGALDAANAAIDTISSIVKFATAGFISAAHGPLRVPCCISQS